MPGKKRALFAFAFFVVTSIVQRYKFSILAEEFRLMAHVVTSLLQVTIVPYLTLGAVMGLEKQGVVTKWVVFPGRLWLKVTRKLTFYTFLLVVLAVSTGAPYFINNMYADGNLCDPKHFTAGVSSTALGLPSNTDLSPKGPICKNPKVTSEPLKVTTVVTGCRSILVLFRP